MNTIDVGVELSLNKTVITELILIFLRYSVASGLASIPQLFDANASQTATSER